MRKKREILALFNHHVEMFCFYFGKGDVKTYQYHLGQCLAINAMVGIMYNYGPFWSQIYRRWAKVFDELCVLNKPQ